MDDEYVGKFPVQTVGSSVHQELWAPAEELAEFNRWILGTIQIVRAFYGTEFVGEINAKTNLPKGLSEASL